MGRAIANNGLERLANATPTNDSRSPSPQQTKRRRLSPPVHQPQTYPSPPQRAPPNNQSHTQLPDHAAQNPGASASPSRDTEQLSSHQEGRWLAGQQVTWDFAESFMNGRPLDVQIKEQFEIDRWVNFEESFMNGRPLDVQITDQEEQGQEEQFTLGQEEFQYPQHNHGNA
jgi:hypothetical protein